ncbi:hypothetical protein Godav_002056 [Gossypium davidsonii]|uniref:PWWP domain-containing protein n=1 Tax=Gossypium davidsonii TaxID=34287 RepID=A0A7J8SWL5_GOSDV|nr:hypothetical protein [Gossypium davidsonii]
MPSLKRCKLGDSVGEDEDNSGTTRKKRKINYYYPLTLLGDVAAGIIPVSLHYIIASGELEKGFAASWNTEVSCSPDEVESKSKRSDSSKPKNRTVEIARPPLVRTSRGRVQVLPSRFNDSVIESWKKESKTSLHDRSFDEDEDDDDFECKKDKFSFKSSKNCKQNMKNQRNKENNGYKGRKYTTLCEEDDREAGYGRSSGIGKYSSFRSSLTSVHEQLVGEYEKNANGVLIVDLTTQGQASRENGEKEDGLYGPEDFYSGDIVWARPGKREPCWPAIVIDPMTQAPELVLRSCIPEAACVMFFGHSGNENQRDYAWVRRGMIFPFADFLDRFHEQPELAGCKPSDFQLAMEEALLAEEGFTEKLMDDINIAAGNPAYDESILRWGQEATGSNLDLGYCLPNQAITLRKERLFVCILSWGIRLHLIFSVTLVLSLLGLFGKCKDARFCESCGMTLPFKMGKKMKASTPEGQFLCKTCARVRCDGCKVWVHAECDKISSRHFKDLGATDYYCPACKAKFNFELSNSEEWQPKAKVVCKCGSCGSEKQALSEWERHTGSRERNWRVSVKVKGSLLPLEQWMLQLAEYHANATSSAKPPKRPSLRERKQKLLAFLQDVKLLCIKNVMEQEMFGISLHGFVKPVKLLKLLENVAFVQSKFSPILGGALKPTDIETLWVHVTCAWFQPEVSFASDEKMEPALGILSIPSDSFVKVY